MLVLAVFLNSDPSTRYTLTPAYSYLAHQLLQKSRNPSGMWVISSMAMFHQDVTRLQFGEGILEGFGSVSETLHDSHLIA